MNKITMLDAQRPPKVILPLRTGKHTVAVGVQGAQQNRTEARAGSATKPTLFLPHYAPHGPEGITVTWGQIANLW